MIVLKNSCWVYCILILISLRTVYSYTETDIAATRNKDFEILSHKVLKDWNDVSEFLSNRSSVLGKANDLNAAKRPQIMFRNFRETFRRLLEEDGVIKRVDSLSPVEMHHLMIPMRDGVKMSTIILNRFPKYHKKSVILSRSPYGPTSDQISDFFLLFGNYAAVIQDQRGTFQSEGEFDMWREDGTDGYDTMKFLSSHQEEMFPWFDGNVFSLGISADGCSALTQILDKPKWLHGQFIMWATGDAHETLYPGGAFREGLISGWMALMAPLTRGVSFSDTLKKIKQHEALSSYYDNTESEGKVDLIDFPAVHLSGWWDIFNREHVRLFHQMESRSNEEFRGRHQLVVGPLGHCAVHEVPRLEIFQPLLKHEMYGWEKAFGMAHKQFQAMKRGESFIETDLKRVNVFVQGPYRHWRRNLDLNPPFRVSRSLEERVGSWRHKEEGNFWVALDDWLPEIGSKFYLSANDHLVENEFKHIVSGKKSFEYDPEAPAPTDGGNSFLIDPLGHRCGSQDQSELEKRKDYISFTSSPMEEATAVCGEMSSTLFVSSNRNDTDIVVALTDVFEDKSMLVSRGIRNLKWRESSSHAVPLSSSKVYEVEVDLGYTCYVFNKGHRIRVSITSSSWPFFTASKNFVSKKGISFLNDKNIQEADEIGGKFKSYSSVGEVQASRGVVAKNTIWFSSEKFHSFVKLPIVSLEELKKNKL